MYLGPFYINTKELFLILAIILIGLAMKFGWGLWWFDKRSLILIVSLMLVTKTILPAIQNEAYFMLGIAAIFLTLYLSIFQIVIFYLISFTLMRWLKLI
ncbi:MAG: hypothetical protein Q7R95_00750 [bacterium]|nr:hypothetical protein [bacterium]